MTWWMTIKANLWAIVLAIGAVMFGIIKYLSGQVKTKESQVEILKKSIDTAVQVNKVNAQAVEVKKEVEDAKVTVNAASDDDVDSLLLQKYTRNNNKG